MKGRSPNGVERKQEIRDWADEFDSLAAQQQMLQIFLMQAADRIEFVHVNKYISTFALRSVI